MLLNETDTAKALNVTKACLRRWRREGRGLPFVRVGRLVRYEPSSVSAFILAHTQEVTARRVAERTVVSQRWCHEAGRARNCGFARTRLVRVGAPASRLLAAPSSVWLARLAAGLGDPASGSRGEAMIDADAVRSRLDYASLFGGHVKKLRRGAGGQAMGLCPFHEDHSPIPLCQSGERIVQMLFVRGMGDVFDFYQKVKGVDFPSAVRELGTLAGMVEGKPSSRRSLRNSNITMQKEGCCTGKRESSQHGMEARKSFYSSTSTKTGKGSLGGAVILSCIAYRKC